MNLLSNDVELLNTRSGYKFSATKLDSLGASEYTLVTLVVDISGSVLSFKTGLEAMLTTIFNTCNDKRNPRRENILYRVVTFNENISELHGFKLLKNIDIATAYNGVINPRGQTALFDAMDESLQALIKYSTLFRDYTLNAITFWATDGQSNTGRINSGNLKADAAMIAKHIEDINKSEKLESLTTVLIGITTNNDDASLDSYLSDVKDGANITQYVSIGKADNESLLKLGGFVSQSISSTSTALGTGQPSTPVNPQTFNF